LFQEVRKQTFRSLYTDDGHCVVTKTSVFKPLEYIDRLVRELNYTLEDSQGHGNKARKRYSVKWLNHILPVAKMAKILSYNIIVAGF